MKRLPVEYRPTARNDIEAIFLYVLETSKSFSIAPRLVDRLMAAAKASATLLLAASLVQTLVTAFAWFLSKAVLSFFITLLKLRLRSPTSFIKAATTRRSSQTSRR